MGENGGVGIKSLEDATPSDDGEVTDATVAGGWKGK
jgi:hypothetical protein